VPVAPPAAGFSDGTHIILQTFQTSHLLNVALQSLVQEGAFIEMDDQGSNTSKFDTDWIGKSHIVQRNGQRSPRS